MEHSANSRRIAEDEIDYSDDDVAITTKNPEPAAEPEKPEAAQASVPAEAEKEAEAPSTEGAIAEGANGEAASADDAAAEKFALNLPPTLAEDEVKKRADRAKRFGLVEDDDERKKADRAKRFGIDNSALAKSLDSALPDRPLKRGRAREDDGGDSNKRQGNNPSNGNRRGDRRHGRGRGGRNNNRGDNNRGGSGGGRSQGSSILADPSEKAKAEARAKRFGSG